MDNKATSYREHLLGALVDPGEASAYLDAAIEDSQEAFLKALKNVAQAHAIAKVSTQAGVQHETLDSSLSEQGNPTLGTLSAVLGVLGMRLSVISRGTS